MKSVIITGATRGIGLALARFYADKGYCLMLNGGHNEEALDAVEKELSTKTQVITCLGSVAEEKTAATIVQKTLDTFGQIDLLINNAGIAHIGLLSDMSSEEWHTLMGTNLDSVFYMSKAVIPHMVHCHSGKILNVSSVWGEVGASCEAAYSATKSGIHGLTKALAKELAPSNIQVNAIACGVIDTEMNARLNEEERAALAEEIPSGRFSSPEEVAELVLLLCSSPSYMTGQIIGMDGGFI